MGFLVSPGVDVNEVDLTNVIPAISTSIGGIVGNFAWGPVEELISVGSEKELASNFSKPDNNTYKQWFQAAAYLKYSNSLYVWRYVENDARNANYGGESTLTIKNSNDFEANFSNVDFDLSSPSAGDNHFAAKYPGALGNSLKVHAITSANWGSTASTITNLFNAAPSGTEIHIAVIDEDGLLSGVANSVLETYADVDTTSGALKDDGTNNFYVDVINVQSPYLWVSGTDLINSGTATEISASFTGGSDGSSSTSIQLASQYSDAFGDPETLDINILVAPAEDGDVSPFGGTADAVIAVAESRKDCIAITAPPITGTGGTALQSTTDTAVTNAKAWADTVTSSSYGVLTSTALYVYDKYNDKYRWIGSAGHVAGLCANVDYVAEPWFSPAGLNRGQLRGVVKLGYNPTQTDRDILYKARVNPIVSFPGQGIILFGDKTAQSKASAFDRINVRRLFIILEKSISTAAKYQLFEFNDEFTRAMFRNMTEPFLRDVKGRRGVTDFLVVCDETNNTGQVIDSNRFVADIYIKPSRSINFITLNFIATRTGVEFSEIAGSQ